MLNYVWFKQFKLSFGYSFSTIHTTGYSLIAIQEMNLAYHYPTIYWNCACLSVDSSAVNAQDFYNLIEEDIVSIDDVEGKKTQNKMDYAKLASALDKFKNVCRIDTPDINESRLGFTPDVKNNTILYGLKGITRVTEPVINEIMMNRPFSSLQDFLNRTNSRIATKDKVINLIKCGAFDRVEGKDRAEILKEFIWERCEPKKKLTLQNFNGLIKQGIIPKDLELQIRVFNFNKYLKTRKRGLYYLFDDECLKFFGNFFKDNIDDLEIIENIPCIKQKVWDNIYQSQMDFVRDWLKENQQEVLTEYNTALFKEMWDKYAGGNISHWEMDSLCFYHGEHELANINNNRYGLVNFNDLSPEPEVDYFFKRNGVQIPIFKLHRIAGTVIAKDDSRTSVTLLTTSGVVTVKFNREYYAMFKKQISQVQPDGTKKVIEKSWFKRGTMLMIQGFRRDDQFVAKNYSHTQGHQLYKITNVVGDEIQLQHERVSPQGSYEEEDYYE